MTISYSPRHRLLARAILLLLTLMPSLALSHELLMQNGDRISGLLVKVEGDVLVWDSSNFGSLTVPKNKVKSLEVSAKVKMEGQTEACTISGLSGLYLLYRCGSDTTQKKVEFALVDSVIPFVEYKEGAYTYSGKSVVAISMERGNEEKDDVDLSTEVSFRQGDYRHLMDVAFESESDDDESSTVKYDLSYRLDWFFTERWFLYNQAAIGLDEHKNIDQSYAFDVGLGVQVWEYNQTALALISGIKYLQEDFDPTDDDLLDPDWDSTREEVFWLLGTDFMYRLPFGINLVSKTELLYSLDESEDWVFEADIGFNVPLVGRLMSEYKFEYDYDNEPNGENRKEDKKLSIGIGYNW